ncbi:PepSY-like domain-containing protein [Bacteroides sp.]|uniref:PepSY-like domain-containing protein n=1 Tax=Bacteroides sp. TaxID=29523 RepID=UPI003AB40874
MNKLKLSLLIGMLMSSVSVFADYAPASVQAALKEMCPTAGDVAWSRDEAYYVADFMMNGFDTKVWFNAEADWVMKQTDWVTMDEVPPAVYNTFAASEFSGDRVQNVTWVQFPRWQAIVAVEVGRSNLQTKYQILFTPNGEILRARNVTYMYNPLGASTFL